MRERANQNSFLFFFFYTTKKVSYEQLALLYEGQNDIINKIDRDQRNCMKMNSQVSDALERPEQKPRRHLPFNDRRGRIVLE